MKPSIFNEYEAIKPEIGPRFDGIDRAINDFVEEIGKEYRLTDIQVFLSLIVVNTCSELRLRNAMEKRKKERKSHEYNEAILAIKKL